MEDEPKKIKISERLSELLAGVSDRREHHFMKEATDCYRVRAFRATIIMVWIMVMHRLHRFVFESKLHEFNAALARNLDRKLKKVASAEDFSEISESKFIELLRAADLINE